MNILQDYVTMYLGDQYFGIPVSHVQDILGPQHITPIPLAPDEIAGVLNLRGRIVTVIDVTKTLGLPALHNPKLAMSVVIEWQHELYSLLVDQVGEVIQVDINTYETLPPTLDSTWQHLAEGVFRLEKNLLIILNVEKVIGLNRIKAA